MPDPSEVTLEPDESATGRRKRSETLKFEYEAENVDTLPDGTRVIFDALFTAPARLRGQVRDIIVWGNGGVRLLAPRKGKPGG